MQVQKYDDPLREKMDLIRDQDKILQFLNESDSKNDDLELARQPGELSGSEEEENNLEVEHCVNTDASDEETEIQ
ncbi:hypothetical protein SFRURICE_008158 [Spodoptera frugiperda]|nr:hypothetical protein SFRURICE_008158 [Spodoptera frugiperda]